MTGTIVSGMKQASNMSRAPSQGQIINDEGQARALNTGTGRYLTESLYDPETSKWNYNIWDASGTPVFGALVQLIVVPHELGTDFGGTINYNLLKTWLPSGRAEPPSYVLGLEDWVIESKEFLQVFRHYSGVKNPDPAFAFNDRRNEISA